MSIDVSRFWPDRGGPDRGGPVAELSPSLFVSLDTLASFGVCVCVRKSLLTQSLAPTRPPFAAEDEGEGASRGETTNYASLRSRIGYGERKETQETNDYSPPSDLSKSKIHYDTNSLGGWVGGGGRRASSSWRIHNKGDSNEMVLFMSLANLALCWVGGGGGVGGEGNWMAEKSMYIKGVAARSLRWDTPLSETQLKKEKE